MLKFYIDFLILSSSFAFFIPLLFSYINRNNFKLLNKVSYYILFVGVISGITIHFLRINNKKAMLNLVTKLNRYAYVLALFFVSLSLIIFICNIFIHKIKIKDLFSKLFIIFVSISNAIIIYLILPQLFNLSMEFIAFGEDSVNTTTLFRITGYLFGIISVVFLVISIYKVLTSIKLKFFNIISGMLLINTFSDYFFKGVSALVRLNPYLKSDFKMKPIITEKSSVLGLKVFDIMIFEDNSLLYIIVGYLIITVLAFMFLLSNKLESNYLNNALLRKDKRNLILQRRWGIVSIVISLAIIFSITYLNSYLTKPVELSEPEVYTESEKEIIIPLSTVNDGHLHRFSYKKDGHDIRFIVVKKENSSAYGIGLDACQICGVAGYYERKNEVVCKRCDVVMNKSTIGFKGGCNPIPFDFKVKDSKIIIEKETLDKQKEIFPVGE